MNDKNLDRQADNMLDNVNDTISLLVRKIEELEQDLIDLEKLYEQVKSDKDESYKKGYENGSKYNDKIWQRRISILKNYHERI
jgi:archaellum component FlaC